MQKRIVVERGNVKALAKQFNTTTVSVWSALKFSTHSDMAKRIRTAAIEMQGEVVGHNANKDLFNH